MAPVLKLYYFADSRARVEVIRLLLAAAKVHYEMIDITEDQWFSEFKQKMPFGVVPAMEIDGKMHGEHIALALYIAELHGYNGKTCKDRLVINQLLNLFEDEVKSEVARFLAEETEKPDKTKDLHENHFPRFLRYFADFIKTYSKGKDFILGKKLTVADLAIYAGTTTMEQECPDLVAQHPEIGALRSRIAQIDGIKQYLASRPRTVD